MASPSMEAWRHGPSYSEGGWGWAVVVACFMTEFIFFGNLKALGVLITSMTEDLGSELWVIGSIASLHYAVQFTLSPLSAGLVRTFSGRSVILIGGTLYGVGLVMSALTRNVTIMALSLVVIAGIGAASAVEMTHAELAFYFREKYHLAVFIALTGSPVGMMLYGPITQVLMDTYGWRGAMLLLGAVGFHLVIGGMLMRRPANAYQAVHKSEEKFGDDGVDSPDQSTPEGVEPAKSAICNLWKSVVSALCLEVFVSAEFMIVATLRMLYTIGYGGVVVYIVPNGLALGLDTREASYLTTAWGVGNLAGLVSCALALDRKLIPTHAAEGLGVLLSAVGFALQPFASPFGAQIATAFVVGAGMGWAVEGILVMTRCLPFADDQFVSVLGWQTFLSGIAASIGDTISGWLSEATGSFHATFLLYSAAMATMLLFLLVDCIRITSRESREQSGLAVLMPSLFRMNTSKSFKNMSIQPNSISVR